MYDALRYQSTHLFSLFSRRRVADVARHLKIFLILESNQKFPQPLHKGIVGLSCFSFLFSTPELVHEEVFNFCGVEIFNLVGTQSFSRTS